MKTILITGGGGFLGKNLIRYLINNNISKKVIVIDNFITSNKSTYLKYINNNKYLNIVDTIEGDISDNSVINTVKELYSNIDEIYHLASLASPKYYKRFPLETLDVGYMGTKNILDLCLYYTQTSQNRCKFLFTSTSEVYGDALQHPQKEDYYGNVNTVGERSCYDESKRVAESLVYTYNNKYSLDTRIVRIFNTYGPHMDLNDGRIVTEIAKSFLLGKKLEIYGTGQQTRSLCYVDDTVKMMVKIMKNNYKHPINVGSDLEISINELVDISKNIFIDEFVQNKEFVPNIVYAEMDKDDPKIRKPCLDLNRNIIGNISFTSIQDGLKNTLNYFKEMVIDRY